MGCPLSFPSLVCNPAGIYGGNATRKPELLGGSDIRLVWHVKGYGDLPAPALRATEEALKPVEGHRFAPGPNERLHIQFGRGVAKDRLAIERLGLPADDETSDSDAPAELPRV
jgi:hypothetical protein